MNGEAAHVARTKACVFDLDDTLLKRGWSTEVVGLAAGKLRPQHLPNLSLVDISNLNLSHLRVAGAIKSPFEHISLSLHSHREAFYWSRDLLKQNAIRGGVQLFVATGRSSKLPWVEMTEASLEAQGLGQYIMANANEKKYLGCDNGVFYTPEGVKTAVSKADALLRLIQVFANVEFNEDDPRTILFLAPRFPNVHFNYIQHGPTGLLVANEAIDRLGNVFRVAVFD